MLRYQDVFVPGGFPRHTYNPRIDLNLEFRLGEVSDNLCKLVTVTGQTKSGKTVLTRKVFPRDSAIWIDGGTISEEKDVWQQIIDQLGIPQTTEIAKSKASTIGVNGKADIQGSIVLVKGSTGVEIGYDRSKTSGTKSSRTPSLQVLALSGLRESSSPLVIDDFHYLKRELQAKVIRALKQIIFDGVPVVIIAIPHRRYDAMKVEREMTGRIASIEIPAWTEDELKFIPTTGFKLLNCTVTDAVANSLAKESLGSPHLMQEFCRGLAKQIIDKGGTCVSEAINCDTLVLKTIFHDVADNIGRPIFEKLARGPRWRTDRISRELKNGQSVDIYKLVLHALAKLKPGLISIEYEDLRGAIRDVSSPHSHLPQPHEVVRVLKHMSTIAASDQSSTPVIDFEEEDRRLHITDPFFAFYLRWGALNN